MPEEEKPSIVRFFETLNEVPVPRWIKKNILTALSTGIGNLIEAGLDVPTAWLESKSSEIRARTKGNQVVHAEAAKQVAGLFKTDSQLASRAINYYAEKIVQQQVNREDVAQYFIREVSNKSV